MTVPILYQLVAPMELTLGTQEIERRRVFLQDHAAAGTRVDVRSARYGHASIESDYDAVVVAPSIIEGIAAAVEGGAAQAAIIGCFSDPALDAAREKVTVPVVGPGESSMLLALQLGDRFSVLSPGEGTSSRSRAHVRKLGLSERYASTRKIGLSVIDLARQDGSAFGRLVENGRACLDEDGAQVIVLGCMSMAFLGMDRALEKEIGAPVVNPVIAALKAAETMIVHRIGHSRLSWPQPQEKKTYELGTSIRA